MSEKRNPSDFAGKRESYETRNRDRATEETTGHAGDESEKRINVNLPESLRDAFKTRCKNEGRTMRYVVEQFARHYVQTGEIP